MIRHSRAEDVASFNDSEEVVGNSGQPVSAIIEAGSDHRLADSKPLEMMLEVCEGHKLVSRENMDGVVSKCRCFAASPDGA